MKKIILVAINCRFLHSNPVLYYLRNAIADNNQTIEVALLSKTLADDFIDIVEQIYSEKPDYIAMSVYIWNKLIVERLIVEVKKILPNIIIILGGPEVSYNADKWIQTYPVIDYIICGSGEKVLNEILQNPEKDVHKKIRAGHTDINDIPFPYTEEDFTNLSKHYLFYESSRGCPFSCVYCLSSRDDQKLKFRDLEKVKNDLSMFMKQGVRSVTFMDRTFNMDKNHSRNIWRFIIEKNPDTVFHFEIHPSYLEDEDLAILKKARPGLFKFEIGIQTINENTLKIIKRKDNWQKSYQNILKLISMNTIYIHLDILVGLPGETLSMFKESFNEVISTVPNYLQIGFLKVLPGTPLAEMKEEYGIVCMDTPPYNVLKTNSISFDEILLLKKINRLITIIYNSGQFKKTFHYLIKCFKTPFDCCSHLSMNISGNFFDIQRDWIKTTRLLLDYITTHLTNEKAFLLDCLRWDWIMMSSGKNYPREIQIESDLTLKKLKNKLRPHLQKNTIIPEKISLPEYNTASIYIPQTDKMIKIMKSDKPLLIITRKKTKIIFKQIEDTIEYLYTINVHDY